MIDHKKVLINSGIAIFAQTVSLVASVLTTLIVPKILGVEHFGYWQLFVFYSTYVGFFHLGLVDGVYLINGGVTRDKLDKGKIKAQFEFSLTYECFFAVVIALVGLFGPFELDRRFVICWTALFLVLSNAWYFFGYLFQAINEPNIYSMSSMLDRFVFIVALIFLLIFHDGDYNHYVLATIVARVVAVAYCLFRGSDILKAKSVGIRNVVPVSLKEMRAGIKLTLASVTGMLVVGIVRIAIDAKWGIEAFSKVSLSISLANFVLLFVQQVSMVLFPALRQADAEEVSSTYISIQKSIDSIAPYVFLVYLPLKLFVNYWLPAYSESMRYFILLMPVCVFDAKMEMCCTTIFKVQRKESLLLKINAATVLACACFVAIGTMALGSIELSLMGMVAAVILRSLVSEKIVSTSFGVDSLKSTGVTVVECMGLSVTLFLFPGIPGAIITLAIIVAHTIVFHRQLADTGSRIKSLVK